MLFDQMIVIRDGGNKKKALSRSFPAIIHRFFRYMNFRRACVLSFVFHFFLVLGFYFSQFAAHSAGPSLSPKDWVTYMQALAETDLLSSPSMDSKDVEESSRKLAEELARLDLSREDKLELFRKLLQFSSEEENNILDSHIPSSLQADDLISKFREGERLETESGASLYSLPPHAGDTRTRLYSLSPRQKNNIDLFKQFGERDYGGVLQSEKNVIINTPQGTKKVPKEYFFRNSPYEEILAQGADLFFIVRGFPPLGKKGNVSDLKKVYKTEPDSMNRKTTDLQVYIMKKAQGIEFAGLSPGKEAKPVLDVYSKPGETERILDQLMAYPEDMQYTYFHQRFLSRFNPNEGDLLPLTREFIYTNLCNIIIVFNPISSAFGFIEQLFFSKPLDRMYYDFWLKHPKNRIGIEFLFTLAGHYDFEKRAVKYLLAGIDDAREVMKHISYTSDVYQKKVKAYIVVNIHDQFMRSCREQGYDSIEQVYNRYVNEQEKVYDWIVQYGGEDKNPALFSLGTLYWEEGAYEKAIEYWKTIDPDFSSKEYKRIRSILDSYEDEQGFFDRIDKALEIQSSRGSYRLLKRLVHFNRWEKRTNRNGIEPEL